MSGAETVSPGDTKAALVPVAAALPAVQSEVAGALYTDTVEPGSAVPDTSGELSWLGDPGEVAGLVTSEPGSAGGAESST